MPKSIRPFAKLVPIPNAAVRWTGGFWGAWTRVCQQVMVPNMWRLLQDDEISHSFANFRIAAGLQPGEHRGSHWHDGDFYKWLEAACHVYEITQDAELERLLDDIIALIARVQRPDGYIHTPVIIAEQSGRVEASAFRERLHFETYNMGHLMTAGCAHFEATGRTSLLEVARKAADFLCQFYQNAAPELARNAICPSHYMGVVDLYRTTGEPRYLDLAKNLIEIRSLVQGGDDNQDRLPFREQEHVVGHAVRANYLYAGVADVVAETGDAGLFEPLEMLWQDLVGQKMYITGGCGALYDGASPDGSPRQEQITRVHQAYGRAYQLPNTTAHNETCANIGNLLWNARMLGLTGQARYADVLELALYNSVLAGISLDGKRFFYTNPLRKVNDLPFPLRWSRTREEYIDCFCCPPNLVRTIAQVGSYAYSVGTDAGSTGSLWVHLYGSSRVQAQLPGGLAVELEQQSDYPFSGSIRMQINPALPGSFCLRLRIPGWAGSAHLFVNDCEWNDKPRPGEYLPVLRSWQSGDAVRLELEMPAELMESHPLVEETRQHLAIRRGPLVYCLEARDLPAGTAISAVALKRDAQLMPVVDPELAAMLPGMQVLQGKVLVEEDGEPWDGRLFRPARSKTFREVETRFIPYFAWDNRGPTEMSVWLPSIS